MGNSDSKSLTDGVGGEAGNLSSTSPIAANKQQKYDDSNNNNYDTTEEDQSSSEKRESADRRTQKRSSASNQRDTTQPSSSSSKQNINKKITDDQIHVNMAMADLMAYLQVVANNSNHLPLTRRDDPELDRTVSTLSSEDYARKSAAFVPANVRILGGTFTRYGRVWDLPTSEVRTLYAVLCVYYFGGIFFSRRLELCTANIVALVDFKFHLNGRCV